MTDPIVRPAAPEDRAGWEPLFLAYAEFYRVAITDETMDAVWAWIHDPDNVVEALVAECEGALVGLAHYRAMPSPLRGATLGFLDDLFVDPAARGARVGEALLTRLGEIANERGWRCVRWITADDNYRARGLYDRVAAKTAWNMYEMGAADESERNMDDLQRIATRRLSPPARFTPTPSS